MQVLVVRKQCVCLVAVEVVIPDANQCEDHGRLGNISVFLAREKEYILLQWCSLKVCVSSVGSSKKLLKVLKADKKSDGKANGRPQGVTAANPLLISSCDHVQHTNIPELKHVLGINAKLGHLFLRK